MRLKSASPWLRDVGCPWGWATCRDAVLCSQPEVLRSARTAARGTPTPGTGQLGYTDDFGNLSA